VDRSSLKPRRAFEVTADWGDIQESELDPPALERLADIRVPTLALLGGLDLDAIHDAARRISDGIPDVRRSTGQTPPTYRRWSAPTTSTHYCGTG